MKTNTPEFDARVHAAILRHGRRTQALDIADELQCKSQSVLASARRLGHRIFPARRKTCQGCLKSRMEAGYYPASVAPKRHKPQE